MKGKVIKFVAFLLIVVLVVACAAPIANAGLVSNAQGESGSRPPPPTPNDSPQTKPSTPSTPTESGPKTITITHMTAIDGYVLDAAGQKIYAGTDSSTGVKPVEGVTVNLMSGDSVVSSMVTGADGHYSFSPSPGTYTVEFIYGEARDKDWNNVD